MSTSLATVPVARRCQTVLNSFHSTVYFAPDLGRSLAGYGVEDPLAAHVACKTAALGRVGPGVATAALNGLAHRLIARHLPAVWDRVDPRTVVALRTEAADTVLRRLLGEEVVSSPGMAEAAGLAVRAVSGCAPQGRPMYAALADLPMPDAPHLALWHAATRLREYRGDGHIALLLGAGLAGLDALVLHTASGDGVPKEAVLANHGWTSAEWDASEERLRARGLLGTDSAPTERGRRFREELESDTDRLDAAPYARLGEEGVARLTELVGGFVATAAEAGAYPPALRHLFTVD
ncbi:hypothetical protein ACFWIN_21805 [Streptomyces sp. NPDC127049]|uniref:SCO6745 family protein n=1 Tax=Streptomyces sp. NPDC127049 TaxID=3347118 RepID=UPI00365E9D1F